MSKRHPGKNVPCLELLLNAELANEHAMDPCALNAGSRHCRLAWVRRNDLRQEFHVLQCVLRLLLKLRKAASNAYSTKCGVIPSGLISMLTMMLSMTGTSLGAAVLACDR